MKRYKPTEFVYQVSEYTLVYKSLSENRITLNDSHQVYTTLKPYFEPFQGIKEAVFAMYLNRRNTVIGIQKISEGGINGTIVEPRIVLRAAIELLASYIILAHNHPSGALRPSKADEDITQKLKAGAGHLDIRLIDHLILSEEGYYSFADEGIL